MKQNKTQRLKQFNSKSGHGCQIQKQKQELKFLIKLRRKKCETHLHM